MKKLELNQLERIEAGGFWAGLAGGVCLAWASAGAVAQLTAWTNPITGIAATALTLGCIAGTADGIVAAMTE